MRIAFIINSLSGGGAERVVQTLTNHLIQQNHEIFIILLNKETQAYNFDSRINIIILKTSIISKSIGKILFIPLQSFELHFLLKKFRIKNAISFLVRANLVFAFTKYFSSHRVILSERNYSKIQYEGKNFKNKIINSLIKNLYAKADLIIPISHGIKKSLVKDYRLDEKGINVIHNPQDVQFIKRKSVNDVEFKFHKNVKYLITLGRLIYQKDHNTLINAFKIIHDKSKNTKLLILGDGLLRNKTQKQIDKLDLNSAVFLMGFVNNPFDFLKRSDVFVLSSRFEGFGNVLVEAMACGLPVISTNCPSGPSEILDNGNYGMLTPVGDANALAAAMNEMLNEENLKEYSKKALRRANDFDVSIIAKEYLKVLELNE
jgi:glycosyltransferase involved in cell wall biosynthesis